MEHEKLVANVIAEQLRQKNLSTEERSALISQLEDSAKRTGEKDTENKDFLQKMAQIAKTRDVATVVLAIIVVGSTAAIKGKLK
jgi:truncated hemoglobin YjbI